MADLFTFTVKDRTEIRADYLRAVKVGLQQQGIEDPNVAPGSDAYIDAEALAGELEVVHANAVIMADQVLPDTATDADGTGNDHLSRLLRIFGGTAFADRPAGGSVGVVINDVSSPTSIAEGALLTDPAGLTYRVLVGGTYADEEPIPIAAVSVGSATNLAEGDRLQWQSAPPFSAPDVAVGPGGLVNGSNAETQDEKRERLLGRLQSPPKSGNQQDVVEYAENADPRVQKAFVYSALQGPGSVHVAVTARPTSTNKSRTLAPTILSGIVAPTVAGRIPPRANVVTTATADQEANVAVGLLLPDAPTAPTPGQGGGWLDATPWPVVDGVSKFRCMVTAVTSTVRITVDAASPPLAGVSRICWLSTLDWKVKTARVMTIASGSPGSYDVTLDTPLPGIAQGALIWPACTNAQAYADALLDAIARLGPGEKTDNAAVLSRASRFPRPGAGWAYGLTPRLYEQLQRRPEVGGAQFLWRQSFTSTLNGPSGTLVPNLPSNPANAPYIFTPGNLAFYRL